MYEYKNIDQGTVTIFDKKGKAYTLEPNQTVSIFDKLDYEAYGIKRIRLEKKKPIVAEQNKPKKLKKGDDKHDSSNT